MRRYETIFILEPDIPGEQRKPLYDKLDELVAAYGGLLIKREEWGVKHLAYSIRKLKRGFYTHIEYCGNGALVDELERLFRINDRFMKYLTVVLDKNADIEAIKEKLAREEAEKEAEAAAKIAAGKAAAESAQRASAPDTEKAPDQPVTAEPAPKSTETEGGSTPEPVSPEAESDNKPSALSGDAQPSEEAAKSAGEASEKTETKS